MVGAVSGLGSLQTIKLLTVAAGGSLCSISNKKRHRGIGSLK